MSRAISVDLPSGPLRVISIEDVVAHAARLLLDLDANVPVPAKHADDYMRLAELVKSSNMETAWQDHRKPTHSMTFDETNRSEVGRPSTTSLVCRHKRLEGH